MVQLGSTPILRYSVSLLKWVIRTAFLCALFILPAASFFAWQGRNNNKNTMDQEGEENKESSEGGQKDEEKEKDRDITASQPTTSIDKHQVKDGMGNGLNSEQCEPNALFATLDQTAAMETSEDRTVFSRTSEDEIALEEASLEEQAVSEEENSEWFFDQYDEQADKQVLAVPLIPENVVFVNEALDNFVEVFESRYGPVHPLFFLGRLEEALYHCFEHPVEKWRPLAVYLHCDGNMATNIFCSQVLCSNEVCEFLSANFVIWPWDLTLVENTQKLLQWMTESVGQTLSHFIANIPKGMLPAIVLVGKWNGTYQLISSGLSMIGVSSAQEVMISLMEGLQKFSEVLLSEKKREQWQALRKQQDTEYEECLRMDQEKKLKKRKEEEQKQLKELKLKEREAEKKKKMEIFAAKLPEEPEENCGKRMVTIKLRLPNGEEVKPRRFFEEEKLETLFSFAASKGCPPDEYMMSMVFPRRDLSTEDREKTLKELSLASREMVIIQEKGLSYDE